MDVLSRVKTLLLCSLNGERETPCRDYNMIRQVLVIAILWSSSGLSLWAQSVAQTNGSIDDRRDSQGRPTSGSESLVAQAVSDSDGITIEELVNLTLSQNKQLDAARTQLRQAEARLIQARLR